MLAQHGVAVDRLRRLLKIDVDEDGAGGDDCADALRYLVATKSRTVVQRKLSGLCGPQGCTKGSAAVKCVSGVDLTALVRGWHFALAPLVVLL